MGLDWIAHPKTTTHRDDKEHEIAKEYSTVFRAEMLNDTPLPDEILRKAYTNMNPPLMSEYAAKIAFELRSNEEKYSEYERTVMQDAVEWLQYWAENKWYVEAWY